MWSDEMELNGSSLSVADLMLTTKSLNQMANLASGSQQV